VPESLKDTARSRHPILGAVCLLLAGYLFAIGFQWLPVDAGAVAAPTWILALCGAVFLLAGVMIFLMHRSRVNDALAAAICLCFSVIGGWAALSGADGNFSGGLPFLTPEQNRLLGRIVFGLGSLACAWMAGYALSLARKRYANGSTR
jgi:hypothetical protein